MNIRLMIAIAWTSCVLAVPCATFGQKLDAAVALRATDFEDALQKANASGCDIVVLQRGSDWNVLGERIYSNLLSKEAFARGLGKGFVLVTVDRPEAPGAKALDTLDAANTAAASFTPIRTDAAPMAVRLGRMVAMDAPMPENQITAVSSAQQVSYARRACDGAYALAPNATKNPDKDTVTLAMKTTAGGSVLRLDFPIDPTAHDFAPGRGPGGNFVISEIEISVNGAPIKADAAWCDSVDANLPPSMAVDGISDRADNGWNGRGELHRSRTLMLALASPAPGGAQVSVKLACMGGKAQIPKALSAAFLAEEGLADGLRQVTQAQTLALKNAKFEAWDTSRCPRIVLLDSAGRMVADDNAPRPKTVEELLETVRRLEGVRVRRDELFAQAAQETGPARALALFRALDLMGVAHTRAKPDCYADIRKQIAEADPADQTGAARRLSFGPDPRDGVPWMEPAKLKGMVIEHPGYPMSAKPGATDADFQAALDAIDVELKDPRNKLLTHEQIQRIMIARYHLYKVWPGHEEMRFDVQREIAAFDPTTLWGIGALGYPAMYHRQGTTPMITYGWGPDQLKAGEQTWDIADTDTYFDHAGPYTLKIESAGGKDAVRVVSVSMRDGDAVLATGIPAPGDDQVAGKKIVSIPLDLSGWKAGRAHTLRVLVAAEPDKLDNKGKFTVIAEFAAPAGWVAPKPSASADPKLLARLESGDIAGLSADLRGRLCAAAKDSPEAAAESLRREVAQYELLRLCGPAKVAEIAKADGGVAFLATFMDDPEWMEAFLAPGPMPYIPLNPGALDGLRFLWAHAHEDLENPFFKRMATALVLVSESRYYNLLQAFKRTQLAWKEGRLHAGFGALPVRLMRWAVCFGSFSDAGYERLLDENQLNVNDTVGAAGLCRYLMYNPYGDWVQQPYYHLPWAYRTAGTMAAPRVIGGVCGTCSSYGRMLTAAHGIPAATTYQPGHNAYMVLQGQEWTAANLVTGMAGTFGPLDWEGTTYATTRYLKEAIESDWPAYIKATRLAWLATAQTEQAKANKTPNTNQVRTYTAALDAQPMNYPVWLAYAKFLEANPTALGDDAKIALATRAARSLRLEHQAPYAMSLRLMGTVLPKLTPQRRAELLLALNREVMQDSSKYFVAYQNINTLFDWQAKQIGDPKIAADFFGRLLVIHYKEPPPYSWGNWVFTALLNWGTAHFAAKPQIRADYVQAMDIFFTAKSEAVEPNFKRNLIVSSIRTASDAGDASSFYPWLSLSKKLLPPLTPADLRFTAGAISSAPQIEPFPGKLLSNAGTLQLSGHSSLDQPLSYGEVLNGNSPGYFDISWQDKPWAQVQLAGEACDVSGVVLIAGYDKPAALAHSLPLIVSVSADGKEWTQVERIESPAPMYRIDLQGKATRVRFVRIQRDGLGSNPANCLFQMRNFLVYGQTLY